MIIFHAPREIVNYKNRCDRNKRKKKREEKLEKGYKLTVSRTAGIERSKLYTVTNDSINFITGTRRRRRRGLFR